ncbi:hypothetical protein QCA50_011375 [Cerrena zonata]|uniref:Uncharacterized protein n=1 Tax=Cerrena zonata TaxID=2478898 RepID=A0AAW0G921_9APHY
MHPTRSRHQRHTHGQVPQGRSWLVPNQHVWLRRSVTPLAVLKEDGLTIAAHYGAEYCPENVSYYPIAVDPSKPWTGSPKSQPYQLVDPGKNRFTWPDRIVPQMEPWRSHGFCPRPGTVRREKILKLRGSKLSLKYWKDAIRLHWDKKACKRVDTEWPGLHGVKRVPLPVDWKQYGYWARPHFPHNRPDPNAKHDHVANSTPPSHPIELSEEEVETMVEGLYDPDGSFHPARWVSRAEHPMLPKRPDLWPTPHASLTNLTYKTPSELILNPLLEHRKLGRPPLLFDIRMGLENILIGGHEGHDWLNPHLGANSSNAYQPATFPGVSAMSINLLAEDTRTTFAWKFTVLPHHPSLL